MSSYVPVSLKLKALMDEQGYYFDELHSEPGMLVFRFTGGTLPVTFETWREVWEWYREVYGILPPKEYYALYVTKSGRHKGITAPTQERLYRRIKALEKKQCDVYETGISE